MGINNKNYSNGSTSEVVFENNTSGGVDTKSRALNMAKVYLYLALQILITAAVSFGTGALFSWWLSKDYTGASRGLSIISIVILILL